MVCFDDLFSSSEASIAYSIAPERACMPSRLLPFYIGREVQGHFDLPEMIEPKAIMIPNAVVSGRCFVGSKDEIYELPTDQRWVAKLAKADRQSTGCLELVDKKERYLEGVSVLITHWNASIYGHWLIECLPKLLWLRRERSRLPPIKLITASGNGSSLSDHLVNWCKFLMPDIPIVIYDENLEYCRCEQLFMPGMLVNNLSYMVHPLLNDLVDEARAFVHPPQGEHIFVTRPDERSYRKMTNKEEIYSIAEQHDFRMFAPEKYSIPEQISVFSSAKSVIGEFGSAMHNSLFCAKETKIVCLNWIDDIQSRIAALREQPIGYILPDDGPLLHVLNDHSQRLYKIDVTQTNAACKLLTRSEGSWARLRIFS